MKDIQDFIQEAQIYATQHAIRIPTEIEGQNFTSDFWQEKKTAELSNLKTQKKQTLKYGEERIAEEREKENFETVNKL
ncbi:MAG: hypothetical protein LUC37_02995 [Prevotella sp.]|nr:hypothetical protein [Prevotella sp.]